MQTIRDARPGGGWSPTCPLGAFLSGGIDSSAVVAAMAQAGARHGQDVLDRLRAAAFDELPHARRVAELFGTEHHEFIVRPDAVALASAIVRHYGEPFADSSAIPSFYLAALTAEHVTVALNGDGGDESFAGYYRYVATRRAAPRRLPLPLRRTIAAAGLRPRPVARRAASRTGPAGSRRRWRSTRPTRHRRYMSCFDPEHATRCYTRRLPCALSDHRPKT